MVQVAAIRLEERDGIFDEVVEPARVVQELADRDALGERRRVSVELEESVRDEEEDEWRHEDLRHAPDSEAVTRRDRLSGRDVGDAGRSLDPATGPIGHDHRPRHSGCEDGFEVLFDFCHEVA
jgi:hypothetical protein